MAKSSGSAARADPQHLLPGRDSLVMPTFSIGVKTAQGSYIGMKSSEQITTAGRDYSMTIPFDTPLQFVVFSRKFRFADQSGAELINGGNVPLTISSSQAAQDIDISVIGTKILP